MIPVARLRPGPALPAFLLMAAVPLLLSGGLLDPSTYPKLAALCVLAASLPFWPRTERRPAGARGNPVLLAASVFIAVQAFSLLRSRWPEEGIWTVLLRALPGAAALLVFRASRGFPQAMRDLSRAAAAGLLAQSAIGGLQYLDLGFQGLPGSPYLPQGTLANKNVFAAWLAMGLPLSAFAATDESRAWRRTAYAAVAAAASLIAVAFSRTGWLILAGLLAAGTAGAFSRGSAGGRALRRTLLAGAGAACLALLWDACRPPGHLAYRAQSAYGAFPDRFASIAAPGDLRNRERLGLWRATLEMAAGNPWTGVGAGGWKGAYPAYAASARAPSAPDVALPSDPSAFPASPHDDFLLLAAEGGAPGLLAYLSVFGAAAGVLAAGWRAAGSRARFAIACLAASLGAYLADAAFNFPGDRAEPALLLGLVLGVSALAQDAAKAASADPRGSESPSDGPAAAAGPADGKGRRAADFAVAALALGGLCLCLARWDAEAHLRRGLEARADGDWAEAERELSRADRPWYRSDRAGTPVAFYRATAALGAGRRAVAESLLVRAYAVNPLHIHVLNDLGSLEVAAGRFREGAAWYGKCLALRPDFTEARENLAAAWFDAGQFRKAKEILAAIPPQARTSRTEAYDRKVDERLKERSGYE